MANKALPFLLLAGAGLLVLGGNKKSRTYTSPGPVDESYVWTWMTSEDAGRFASSGEKERVIMMVGSSAGPYESKIRNIFEQLASPGPWSDWYFVDIPKDSPLASEFGSPEAQAIMSLPFVIIFSLDKTTSTASAVVLTDSEDAIAEFEANPDGSSAVLENMIKEKVPQGWATRFKLIDTRGAEDEVIRVGIITNSLEQPQSMMARPLRPGTVRARSAINLTDAISLPFEMASAFS